MAIFLTVISSLALAALPLAMPIESQADGCAAGLYMIVARGTNEPRGQGKAGLVADMVAARVRGSVSVAVDYPASAFGSGPFYPQSVSIGIRDTKNKIETYVDECGDQSRIVLIGFSQGGNVMTDTLAGGILKPAPLSERYRKYIKAVAVLGDPAFAAKQIYDFGTAADGPGEGIFSRSDNEGSMVLLSRYADVLASYCDDGDVYCASGDDPTVHGNTIKNYAQDAADFILSRAS